MTDTVKITGINLADTTKPWDNGDTLHAHFDCQVRGFKLNGCLLIYAARGVWIAQPPKGDSGRGTRAVQIVDGDLRKAITDAAHQALDRLVGSEAAR